MLALLLSALLASPEIDDLVLAYRMLASREAGVLDVYGDVSVRSRTNPKRFYIARAVAPPLVTASDIVEEDLDGAQSLDELITRFGHAAAYQIGGTYAWFRQPDKAFEW